MVDQHNYMGNAYDFVTLLTDIAMPGKRGCQPVTLKSQIKFSFFLLLLLQTSFMVPEETKSIWCEVMVAQNSCSLPASEAKITICKWAAHPSERTMFAVQETQVNGILGET